MIATTLLLSSAVAAGIALLCWRRAQAAEGPAFDAPLQAASRTPAPRVPARTVNPKLLGMDVGLWELRASPTCEFAKSLHGRRMETADTIALPLPGCNAMTCDCHYVPVRDNRRGVRRKGEERREALRFDPSKKERRAKDRRRRAIWDGKR
jgi:hypothetical protein